MERGAGLIRCFVPRITRYFPQGEPRAGPGGERFDFKGGEAGIDRNDASAGAPDGQDFDQEFCGVAEVKKDTVAGGQAALTIVSPPGPHALNDLGAAPYLPIEGLDQSAGPEIEEHAAT
jgi:hypothetical protein